MASTLSLYCWGADNGYGNLGLNAVVAQHYPTMVTGGGQWKAVFADDYSVSVFPGKGGDGDLRWLC